MHKNVLISAVVAAFLLGCGGGGGGGCGSCALPDSSGGASGESGAAGSGGGSAAGGSGGTDKDNRPGENDRLPADEEWQGAELEQLSEQFAELKLMYSKEKLKEQMPAPVHSDFAAAKAPFSTDGWPGTTDHSPDKFNAVFFPEGWNAEVKNAEVIAAIIDSGFDNTVPIAPGYEGHYTYEMNGVWPDLATRMDTAAHSDPSKAGAGYLKRLDYAENITYTKKDGALVPEQHGSNVAHLISQQLPNAKFVNLIAQLGNVDANGQEVRIDEPASIDAAAYKGVRFFNRSVANDLDMTAANPASYYPATMHYNALFLSAASNDLIDGHFTQNALLPTSPMRRGWIIVSGFGPISEAESNFEKKGSKYWRSEEYFIEENGQKITIYPWGNSCKEVGWQDCISAPFFASPVAGEVGMGTSYATPLVTSVAMSVYAKYPWMSNINIKQTLFSTAYKVHAKDAKFEPYVKHYFGVGAINPSAAMRGPADFGEGAFDADVDEGLYVFGNKISGGGGLNKSGDGTLVLSEENSFSGQVNVLGGELWLLGKNAAPVKNSARLRMASGSAVGALQNDGLLISEGFSAASLELGESSRLAINLGQIIDVAGTAKLGGTLGIIGATKGYVAKNEQHEEKILKATEVSGEFSNVSSQSAFIKPAGVNYGAQEVSVRLEAADAAALPALGQYAAANYARVFEAFDVMQAQNNPINAPAGGDAEYNAVVKQGRENVPDGSGGYKRDDAKYPLCGGKLGSCEDNRGWAGAEAGPDESRVAVASAQSGSTGGAETGDKPASAGGTGGAETGDKPAARGAMRTAAWLQSQDIKSAQRTAGWLFGGDLRAKYAAEFAKTRALLDAAFSAEKTELSQLNFWAKTPGDSAYLGGAMMSYAASVAPGLRAIGFAGVAGESGGESYALFGSSLRASLGDSAALGLGAGYLHAKSSRALGASLSAQLLTPTPLWRVGLGLNARYLRQDFAASETFGAHINKSRFEQTSLAAMLLASAQLAGLSADFGLGARLANASDHEFGGEFMGARLLNGGKIAPKTTGVAKIGLGWQLGRWHIGARAGAEFARGGYASGFLGLGARFLF